MLKGCCRFYVILCIANTTHSCASQAMAITHLQSMRKAHCGGWRKEMPVGRPVSVSTLAGGRASGHKCPCHSAEKHSGVEGRQVQGEEGQNWVGEGRQEG